MVFGDNVRARKAARALPRTPTTKKKKRRRKQDKEDKHPPRHSVGNKAPRHNAT